MKNNTPKLNSFTIFLVIQIKNLKAKPYLDGETEMASPILDGILVK